MSLLLDVARPHLRHNFVVHTIDAGFFGLGLGFASFITLLPLFVATLTDAPIAIGMIAVIHPLGWHLPQIVTARRVSGLRRYLPTVLFMTIHERLPFFLLAGLALIAGALHPRLALFAVYAIVLWIGLGGGLTANAFQSMVARIVPPRRRGSFYGAKTACANFCLALGAVAAGRILGADPNAADFAPCFALAGVATIVSWFWLAWTREPDAPPARDPLVTPPLVRAEIRRVLLTDPAFRRYLIVRWSSQVAMMATAYYTVYAVGEHGLTATVAGWMTAVFAGAQVIGNPIMGWAGDRIGYRRVMALGMVAAGIGAIVAAAAPELVWFYLVFALAGVANVAAWTLPLSMTLEFGTDADRPVYIGLANSLIAPSIVLAPLLGGWIAQIAGYGALFLAAASAGVVTAFILLIEDSGWQGRRLRAARSDR